MLGATGLEIGKTATALATMRRLRISGWAPHLLVAMIGLGLTTAAFIYTDRADLARIAGNFELRATWRAQDLRHKLDIAAADAQAVASYIGSEPDPTPSGFHNFLQLMLRPQRLESSIYWAPLVEDQDRGAFVAAARRDLGSSFEIFDTDAANNAVPSPRRSRYLPRFLEETRGLITGYTGFDIFSLPYRKATAETARDTGDPIATHPYNLPVGLDNRRVPGFLIMWPVYRTITVPAAQSARREAFRGLVTARYRFDEFLPAIIANTPRIIEPLTITISSNDGQDFIAHFDPASQHFSLGGQPPPSPGDGFTFSATFEVFGQRWTVSSPFGPDLVAPLRSSTRWITLTLGLLLTTGALAALHREQRSRLRIQSAVEERTASLSREAGERLRQEIVARESATRLQMVLDTALHSIILIDASGTVLLFNPAAEALFGYEADEVLGQNVSRLMPPPDDAQHDTYLHTGQLTPQPRMIGRRDEVTGRHKDGSSFPMELSISETTEHGTPIFVAMIVDLTERKQHEFALRRWADAFDKAAFGIAIANADDDTIELVNPAFAAMLGTAPETLLGMSVFELYAPGERARLVPHFRSTDPRGHAVFEARLLRADRTTFPAMLDVSFIPSITGSGFSRIGTILDLTERKRTEAALADSRRTSDELLALLDVLQTEAPIGIGFVNSRYRFERVNHVLADMTGATMEQHIGQTIAETMPEQWLLVQPYFGKVLKEGQSFSQLEIQGRTANSATVRCWLVALYPVRTDGTIIGVGMIVSDVTQQRQTEEQLRQAQKMEAIGNLTGGMAHDFNNLLGVIIGSLDQAHPALPDLPDAQALVTEALEAALSGSELTRRLLAFARRQPLRTEPVVINDMLTGLTRLLARTLGERITVSLALGAETWPVETDPAQLEACIVNLATNARDAMPDGGTLLISTTNKHLDDAYAAEHTEVTVGDYAVIKISDTGTGISPDMLVRIFEPFFTTKEPGKGTGLGLSMVFGFVKQTKGHISVYSELGHGTTFRLYLPRTEQVAIPASTAPVQPQRGGGEIVLVAEDNGALRRIAVRQLRNLGYLVIEAETADAALAVLEQEKIDLLLTDVVMPGRLDGFGLAREVLARWPHTRILLTSGFPETRVNDNLDSVDGTVQLLSKPYRLEQLASMVRLALQR